MVAGQRLVDEGIERGVGDAALPRAMLIRNAVGFMACNTSAPINSWVSSS